MDSKIINFEIVFSDDHTYAIKEKIDIKTEEIMLDDVKEEYLFDDIYDIKSEESNLLMCYLEEVLRDHNYAMREVGIKTEEIMLDDVDEDNIFKDVFDNKTEKPDSLFTNHIKSEEMEDDTEFGSADNHLHPHGDTSSDTSEESDANENEVSQDKSPTELHKCGQCNKCFVTRGILNRHMRTHAPAKPYKCTECDQIFATSSSLSVHARLHTGQKPFHCKICDIRFYYSSVFSAHMINHGDYGKKIHQCDKCNKKFSRLHDLRKHILTHKNYRPHHCPVCPKMFSLAVNLERHMQIHIGEKTFECDLCSEKFNDLSNLTNHMQMHTTEKSYECLVCEKKYSVVNQLTKHQSTRAHKRKTLGI